MPFDPDAPTPAIDANAVNVVDGIEYSMWMIWHEWITGWFDGSSHAIDDVPNNKTFPLAAFSVQQMKIGDDFTGINIHAAVIRRQPCGRKSIGGKDRAHDNMNIRFWIRARHTAKDDNTADAMVVEASDLLWQIINKRKFADPLNAKGIVNPRAGYPLVAGDTDYKTRMISVDFRLWYDVDFTA